MCTRRPFDVKLAAEGDAANLIKLAKVVLSTVAVSHNQEKMVKHVMGVLSKATQTQIVLLLKEVGRGWSVLAPLVSKRRPLSILRPFLFFMAHSCGFCLTAGCVSARVLTWIRILWPVLRHNTFLGGCTHTTRRWRPPINSRGVLPLLCALSLF